MLAELNCPDCAHWFTTGSKYCTQCGLKLKSAKGQAEVTSAADQIMEDLCSEIPPATPRPASAPPAFPDVLFQYGDISPTPSSEDPGYSNVAPFPHESIYSAHVSNRRQPQSQASSHSAAHARTVAGDSSELPYFLQGYELVTRLPADKHQSRLLSDDASSQSSIRQKDIARLWQFGRPRLNLRALGAVDSSLALLMVAYCGAVVWWVAHLVDNQSLSVVQEAPQTVGASIVASKAENQLQQKSAAAPSPQDHKRPADPSVGRVAHVKHISALPAKAPVVVAPDSGDSPSLGIPDQPVIPTQKYKSSDIAQYNQILADYFARQTPLHQSASTIKGSQTDAEPPTLDEWLNQGKPQL